METVVVSNDEDFIYPTIVCITFLVTLLLLKLWYALKTFLDRGREPDLFFDIFLVMIIQDIYIGFIISAHVILLIMMLMSIDTGGSHSLLSHPGHFLADDNRALVQIKSLMWLYYILKILQLGQIVLFFVIGGNILMLFHRISMVLMAWYAAKYAPGGTVTMWELLDCAIFLVILVGICLTVRTSQQSRRFQHPDFRLIVNVIVIFSHLLVFANCVGIIWMRCPFPPGIAEFVMIYMLVIFVWICLQQFQYYQQGRREVLDYYFWEPHFFDVYAFSACVVFIPLLGILAIIYNSTFTVRHEDDMNNKELPSNNLGIVEILCNIPFLTSSKAC